MALGDGITITGFQCSPDHLLFDKQRSPLAVDDVRFPTSLTGDGSDAVNQPDYSCVALRPLTRSSLLSRMAYIELKTNDTELSGFGMTVRRAPLAYSLDADASTVHHWSRQRALLALHLL